MNYAGVVPPPREKTEVKVGAVAGSNSRDAFVHFDHKSSDKMLRKGVASSIIQAFSSFLIHVKTNRNNGNLRHVYRKKIISFECKNPLKLFSNCNQSHYAGSLMRRTPLLLY